MYFVEINQKVQSNIFSPPARQLHRYFTGFYSRIILLCSVKMEYTPQVIFFSTPSIHTKLSLRAEDLGILTVMVSSGVFEGFKLRQHVRFKLIFVKYVYFPAFNFI